MATLITSYSETLNSAEGMYLGGPLRMGQSFLAGSNYLLSSCKFSLAKNGSPTGYVQAELYEAVGTYHYNMEPGGYLDGGLLATSDARAVASLSLIEDVGNPSNYVLKEFIFTGVNKVVLHSGSYYCIVFRYTSSSEYPNTIGIGESSTNQVGDQCYYYEDWGYWGSSHSYTLLYEVYGNSVLLREVRPSVINISDVITGISESIKISVTDIINISNNTSPVSKPVFSFSPEVNELCNISDSVNLLLYNEQLGDIDIFDKIDITENFSTRFMQIDVSDSLDIGEDITKESFRVSYGRSPLGSKAISL